MTTEKRFELLRTLAELQKKLTNPYFDNKSTVQVIMAVQAILDVLGLEHLDAADRASDVAQHIDTGRR